MFMAIAGQIQRRSISSFLKHQERAAYIFIAPPVLLFICFSLIPAVMGFSLSFTNYDVISRRDFIGLTNFKKLFNDEFFWKYSKNTLRYVVMYMPFSFLCSLGTALLLNYKRKGAAVFRTCFYLPVLSSTIASAAIWLWLYNPQAGAINILLDYIGISGPAWLWDTKYAMPSIVVMCIWAGFGGNMMIFLAGLQGVPAYLYESAKLDGANRFQEFWYITLPGIGTTTFFVTTNLIIGSLQMFDQAYVLTGGGPGGSTKTLVYYIYENGFSALKMGYASAMSFVLFAVIFIFSMLNMKLNSESGNLIG
jgi:multiple sugar transport system permease protein